jgi:hypothetical protein
LKTFGLNILLLIIAMRVNAQENYCRCDTIRDNPFEPQLAGERFFWNRNIHGSIYFFKDFVNGDIRLSNGEWVYNKVLNFNGFADELIMFDAVSLKQIKLDKKYIREFRFKDPQRNIFQDFKKIKTGGPADLSEVFAQVLLEDRISLFVYRKIELSGHDTENLNGDMVAIDIYSPVPIYILRLPDGRIETFNKINRKALIKSFPGLEKDIKYVLRKNHIRIVKNEAGLIEVISILNKTSFP